MNAVQKRFANLVGLAAVGALAGFLLFWQAREIEEEEIREQQDARILKIDPSGIRSIEIESATARYEIEKSNDTWQLVAPIETPAEKSTVDGLLRHLSGLERIRWVGEKKPDGGVEPPRDLWVFDLEPPRFVVTVEDASSTVYELRVGKKATFDGTLYVQRGGEPAVAQVDGALEYQVDKSLLQLREKRLAVFDENGVQSVAVWLGGKPAFSIERADTGFRISSPRELAANREMVTGMVSALAHMRATAFVSERATRAELRRFDLDRPSARILLTFSEESPELTVLISQQAVADARHTYASRGDGSPILQLGSDWVLRKVRVTVDDLRDKRVFPFDRDRLFGLVIHHDGGHLSFEKSRDDSEERTVWTMTHPETGKAQAATLTGLVYRLWNLEAKRIVHESANDAQLATAGLAEPSLRLELRTQDGTAIGSILSSTAKGGERHVTSSRHARVDLIDGTVIDEISLDPKDYLELKSETER